MSSAPQLRLFPAGPLVEVPRLTPARLAMLTRLEAAECEAVQLPHVRKEVGQALRWLIAHGLIEVMAVSPARYRVTKLGKVARRVRA